MAADDALQIRRTHPTESAMLILATIFFIVSSYLVVSETRARYVRGPSEWEMQRGDAVDKSNDFIDDLDAEREENGLATPDDG